MRRTVLSCLAAAALSVASPAGAEPGTIVLVGTFHYVPGQAPCYPYYCCAVGGGYHAQRCTGTGEFIATGTRNGSVRLTFEHWEASYQCPATGSMYGTMSGALNGSFTWVRVGTTAWGNVEGDTHGALHGETTVATPEQCAAEEPVDFTAVITIAGT